MSDFSSIPNFFYPPQAGPSTASASISPGNLLQPPYSTFLNASSGSDFPLQQPIFAPPPLPTSRRSSNAVLTTSSVFPPPLPIPSSSSSTTTPSSTPSSSSFNGGVAGLSRPSTAPSLSHNGRSSIPKPFNNGQPQPPPPSLPSHQLRQQQQQLELQQQQPSVADFKSEASQALLLPTTHQHLLTSAPQEDTKSKVKLLGKSESSASQTKKDNISPVTGRPKRPRRKVRRLSLFFAFVSVPVEFRFGSFVLA